MKCEICGKDIELKHAYSPIRYQIGVFSNQNQSMLARAVMYEFVCEECGEEIKRKIMEIKEIKSTKTRLNNLLLQKSFEETYRKSESRDCW